MKQLSILFILFLLYSSTSAIITRINGPKSCDPGYLHKCAGFGLQLYCKCFKECQVGQKMECTIVGLYNLSCSCAAK